MSELEVKKGSFELSPSASWNGLDETTVIKFLIYVVRFVPCLAPSLIVSLSILPTRFDRGVDDRGGR